MKKIHGVILTMMSSASFGFLPIWAKHATSRGSNSITLLFFRFFIPTVLLFAYFLIKKVDFKVTKRQLIELIVISVIGYVCATVTLSISYDYISSGLATTMHFIYPAVVTILMWLVYKEKMHFGKIASILFSICGIYFLIYTKNVKIDPTGAFLALISGAFYAVYVIGVDKTSVKELDIFVSTFYVSTICSICIFIFGYFFVGIKVPLDYAVFFDYGCAGIIGTLFGLVAFIQGVKIIGATNAAILSTFEPIVSVVMGILILNEKITISIVTGIVLIVISVILLTLTEKQSDTKEIDEYIKGKAV